MINFSNKELIKAFECFKAHGFTSIKADAKEVLLTHELSKEPIILNNDSSYRTPTTDTFYTIDDEIFRLTIEDIPVA